MNIQTISIVVPTKGCINKCPFCVSKMHHCPYENKWDEIQMIKRIQYAMMNSVNTCVITGTGEALQNIGFLNKLGKLFNKMNNPFPNIEIQTTGIFLSEKEDVPDIIYRDGEQPFINYPYLNILENLRVNTVSISVCDIFDYDNNLKIIGVPEKLRFHLGNLIDLLKKRGFNIRLSLNMLNTFDRYTPEQIISKCKGLQADQITFRAMYSSGETNESKWVKDNKCSDKTMKDITEYFEGEPFTLESESSYEIKLRKVGHGKFLYRLPFGGKVYSMNGMSTVIDDDCMSKENNESLKYVILRENGKLYSRWDDLGSLIF
jgi:hypothetical protein